MQFISHNHNVFLRKKEHNIFVEKIGVKFPERIRRESDILKILVSYPGIPQIISEDLLSNTPYLKLAYIEAKPFDSLENNELNCAAKQVAIWLRKFANSGYSLPLQINSKYSAQQRDTQMFQKVKTLAEKINSKEILNCVHKVQKYQKRKRIHCAHRDFRIDHVFLDKDNKDVWVIDWESASDGYMLQDAGNFIASILKRGHRKTKCINMFIEEFSKDCSDSARQELIDWTVFSLLWGSYVQKNLLQTQQASHCLNLAKAIAYEKLL